MIEIIISILLSLPIGTIPTDVNKDKKTTTETSTDKQPINASGGSVTWTENG